MTVIYTKRCMCQSKDKQRLKELKQYDNVEVRIVTRLKEWRAEADSYGAPMPFYVDNGAVFNFYSGEKYD